MQRIDRVHRSGYRESRWMSHGNYRPKVSIDWKALVADVLLGASLGLAILVGLYNVLGVY